jgi:3-oxoacyl-[acyl-carrier protein] reductase
MPRQNGQGAIVTGASRGIGAAVARRLASDGFNVVINYAGRPEEAEAQVGIIRQSGGTAVAVRADVGNPAEMRHLFDEAEAQFGHVDVLVNNAGIMLVECRMSATSCVDERDSPIHFVLAFNMDTNIVSMCGFRKHSIFDRRPRPGGNRTLRESLYVGNSRRERECQPGVR